MKAGFFTTNFGQYARFEDKRKLIGWNTGNIIFRDALHKMLDCDILDVGRPFDPHSYGAFVTSDLIWLKENAAPWAGLFKQLELAGDKPLVPISIGMQSPNLNAAFKMHPKMADFLKLLSERVPLAVRGHYTQDILHKHGVSNTEVMGCPSIYQLPLYLGSLAPLLQPCPETLHAVANFRTFVGALTPKEVEYLHFIMAHFDGFAEQTFDPLSKVEGVDQAMIDWMTARSHNFFDLDSWRRHNLRYTFSMGQRFHGNVAALLAGVPSLFVRIDSRTTEMTEFLKLPSIAFADFSADLPLSHYYDLADYADFAASYRRQIDRFGRYLAKCGLSRSMPYQRALDAFTF